jgi:hypothetical protein
MYSGYVLFCNKMTLGQCVSKRQFTFSDNHQGEVEAIKQGSILFMYNPEAKSLIGPFSAAEEGAARIETGAWSTKIDEHSASANVKLEWEDLHIIENVDEKLPFISKLETCALSTLQVQQVMDALKEASSYHG